MTESETRSDNLNNAIIQWACTYLSSHGYTLKSALPENVQKTPWSTVLRFATSEGYIYLKHTPEQIALEANIIRILRDQFHISVPEVIAHNIELNCFLMKDAGRSLREILKKQFDTELFSRAIHHFTSMQLVVVDHVNIFLDMGVPDWRLDKLPDLYVELLSQKEILIEDGLSEKEINELENLLPTVFNLCQKLSAYAIKQSIVQPDFNDNNTLIADNSRDITIIDLGEIVISHPFFSLINCLDQAKKHYVLIDKDEIYQNLFDACLKNFMNVESKENLVEAFVIARILYFIYWALANYRLRVACDKVQFASIVQMRGRLSMALRQFKKECVLIDKV
jgi:hypothetical protein